MERDYAPWFPYFDVFCAATACSLWLLLPGSGFWPLIIGLTPWIIRWVVSGKPSHHTPFDWPLALFLITAVVSIWSAFDRDSAISKFWLLIGALLLYFAFANWAAEEGTRALKKEAWILALLGAFISIYFLLTHDWEAGVRKLDLISHIWQRFRSVVPELPLESFHPNVIAGAIAILVPFGAAVGVISWLDRRRWAFALACLIVVICLLGLAMSSTRGAWIAVMGAALLAMIWMLVRYVVRGRRRRRAWFFAAMGAALLISILVIVVIPGVFDFLISSLPSLESGAKRADLYQNSLMLLNDYPIIGAGLDNFMMVYSSYALLLHVGFTTHAHNLAIDLSVQQGILAVIALIWMLLLMGIAVWHAMRQRSDRDMRQEEKFSRSADLRSEHSILVGAAALSIVILLAHGLIDDAIYATRMVVLMFVPFAFAVPILLKTKILAGRQKLRGIALGLIIVLVVLLINRKTLFSMFNSNLAAVRQGQAELGVYKWPDWPVQDAVRLDVDLSPAIASYEKALSLNPGNVSANRRMGQIMLSLGNYREAEQYLEAAYSQAPWDNSIRQMLGEAYLVNGRLDEGTSLWAQSDNALGQLLLRAAWYQYIGEMERYMVVDEAARLFRTGT